MVEESILFIIDLFKDNITVNNKTVPVIFRSYPYDKTPCITLDNSGGSAIEKKYRRHTPYEEEVTNLTSHININVWANNEPERESINSQILDLISKLNNYDYHLCVNYNNGQCSFLEAPCEAIDSTTAKGVKNKCPKPTEYGYGNPYTAHHVHKFDTSFEFPFNMDDLNKQPVLLRSIIKAHINYDHIYYVGGKVSERVKNKTIVGD